MTWESYILGAFWEFVYLKKKTWREVIHERKTMTLVRTLRRKLEWRNLIHHIMVKKASTMLSRWSKN